MNVPKLRFKEFTGEWEQKKLGSIIYEYGQKSTVENQYPMLTSSRDGILLQEDYYSSDNRLVNRSTVGYNILPYGYVTFRNRSDDGYFYFNINNKIDYGLISYFYPVFNVNNYDANFIIYLLNNVYKKTLNVMSTGTSQKVLSFSQLKELDVLLPSIDEHNKISKLMLTVTTKIEKQKAIVESLEKQKKGLMQKIFSQELRFKDDDGKEFPAWEEKQLGEVMNLLGGYAFSSKDDSKSGVIWTKIANVGINKMNDENISYLPVSFKNKYKDYILRKGDIVIALTRPILNHKLKVAIIDDLFGGSLLNQRVGKIITVYNKRYMYFLLQSDTLVKCIEDSIAGTDPPNLSPEKIKDIIVAIPSGAEIEKLTSFFTLIESKLNYAINELERWQRIKKGLLQQMFV